MTNNRPVDSRRKNWTCLKKNNRKNKEAYTNCYSVLGRLPNKTSSYLFEYVADYKISMKELLKNTKSRLSYSKSLFDSSGQQYIGWIVFTKEKTKRTNKTFDLSWAGELTEINRPKGLPLFENYKQKKIGKIL